jgi:DeoR/GlpR family transcriptional regulator of sugar metabolism
MGVHGMDAKAGFTCPNLSEAETDRALIEAGRRLVVIADHSKWGVVGIASIARLDQADVLVSDRNLDPAGQQLLGETVHELILVDVDGAEGTEEPEVAMPLRRVAAGTGSRAH